MSKFKEFNKKWGLIIKEAVKRIEEEGLLDIREEKIIDIVDIDLFVNVERFVSCNMVSENLKVYEINNDTILAERTYIIDMLKNKIEDILNLLIKEKNINAEDTEIDILLELLLRTVTVSIGSENIDSLPIFKIVSPKAGYIKVYSDYIEIVKEMVIKVKDR